MRSIFTIICILFFCIYSGFADNTTIVNSTNQTSTIPVHATLSDISQKINTSASDQQFLFLMSQYWIPDLYDIKGRMDGAASFGADVPEMLNLSADYAKIRLNKNINETNGYSLSPEITSLKTQYQIGAEKSVGIINGIMTLNRTDDTFSQQVPSRTAALSLYGTWLEYQVMRCYDHMNMTYPDIAQIPPDQFIQIMGVSNP